MIMECREVRQLVESFVTEQLLVETTHGVMAHLGHCAACRAEIDGLRRLRAATREAFDASADLRARPEFVGALRARLQAPAGLRASTSGMRRWAAVAAVLLLVAGGGLALRQWSALGLTALLHAAVGDHQFCALTYKLPAPPITLAEAGRRYDPVNAAFETVEPSPAALRGGPVRVVERHSCVYDGRRFAHIVVEYKGRAASILIAEKDALSGLVGRSSGAGPVDMPETGGFHVAAFRASNRMVFVVSSLDGADVQEVARAMVAPISKAAAGA